MADYAPITLRIVDEAGKEIFRQDVPFEWEIDVKQIMERAFVLTKTPANPDPLPYSVEYYGYSESDQFPGYLGYEVESIFGKVNNNRFFWALSINGVLSTEGADSMQPAPGSTVVWQFTPIPAGPVTSRAGVVRSRRAERAKLKA